jgi:hypothetical protein
MDPHAGRRVAIQQLGAELTHAAIGWGVRPDELRAGRSIASRDHIKIKEKMVGCVVEEWATLRALAQAFHA